MAETYLVEISTNDELENVVRKVNANFKQLAYSQSQKTAKSARTSYDAIEGQITDVRSDMQTGFNQVSLDMQALQAYVDSSIAAVRAALTPPVGTMMFSSSNPSTMYTGTTWVQMNEGTVLISAGSTYTDGSNWDLSGTSVASGGSLLTAAKLWKRTA